MDDSLDLAKKLLTRLGVAVAAGIAFGSAVEGWLGYASRSRLH